MIKRFTTLRRLGAVLAAVSAAIVAGLVGGASNSRAATSFTITLTPLIGSASVNVIPQVSYAGKIGYHLFIQNSGASTTQHVSVVVTSNVGTFFDSDNASCAANPNDAHQMICTPFGGTFVPGAIFEVNLRFDATATGPASGQQVSTDASITVSAQTVGGKNNNGTTLVTSDPVVTNIVENTAKADTYLRANEDAGTSALSTSHPQNFGLSLPTILFGAPFGVALSIHDEVGTPICASCLASFTRLTIPVASSVTTSGNPFYDGTDANGYSWTMNAKYPPGFKLTGIFHLDDANVLQPVPSCASIGGGPTAADPICWDTLTQDKGAKTVSASGRGIENGNIAFG